MQNGEKISATLKAVGSHRKIALNNIRIPAVLILHGQNTQEAAEEISRPLREKYPLASEIFIASVIDLRIVPRLMRGVAEKMMLKGYKEAASLLPPEWDAEDYIFILTDWKGVVSKHFGFEDTHNTAAIAVLDKNGNIVGSSQGEDLPITVMELISKIM